MNGGGESARDAAQPTGPLGRAPQDDQSGNSALVRPYCLVSSPRRSSEGLLRRRHEGPRANSNSLSSRPNDAQMLEGSIVNVAVTSPAATLAMGLVFLKTNDAAAAGRIVVPSTYHALDTVRPDLLLLRVVARSLILWDSVEPTKCACAGLEQTPEPLPSQAKASHR